MGHFENGGGYAYMGAENIGKISVPSAQRCYGSKSTLKSSLLRNEHKALTIGLPMRMATSNLFQ